jgi:hypothetical protein
MSVGTMRVYRRPWVKSTPPSPPATEKRVVAVPTIVPAARQNCASRANGSQVGRSVMCLRVWDLRGNPRIAERRVSVQQTAAFSLSATSPRLVSIREDGTSVIPIWPVRRRLGTVLGTDTGPRSVLTGVVAERDPAVPAPRVSAKGRRLGIRQTRGWELGFSLGGGHLSSGGSVAGLAQGRLPMCLRQGVRSAGPWTMVES